MKGLIVHIKLSKKMCFESYTVCRGFLEPLSTTLETSGNFEATRAEVEIDLRLKPNHHN